MLYYNFALPDPYLLHIASCGVRSKLQPTHRMQSAATFGLAVPASVCLRCRKQQQSCRLQLVSGWRLLMLRGHLSGRCLLGITFDFAAGQPGSSLAEVARRKSQPQMFSSTSHIRGTFAAVPEATKTSIPTAISCFTPPRI